MSSDFVITGEYPYQSILYPFDRDADPNIIEYILPKNSFDINKFADPICSTYKNKKYFELSSSFIQEIELCKTILNTLTYINKHVDENCYIICARYQEEITNLMSDTQIGISGSVGEYEMPITTAKRELLEEINININQSDIYSVDRNPIIIKEHLHPRKHFIYACEIKEKNITSHISPKIQTHDTSNRVVVVPYVQPENVYNVMHAFEYQKVHSDEQSLCSIILMPISHTLKYVSEYLHYLTYSKITHIKHNDVDRHKYNDLIIKTPTDIKHFFGSGSTTPLTHKRVGYEIDLNEIFDNFDKKKVTIKNIELNILVAEYEK